MRGGDSQQGSMFSYRSLEDRIPEDHPLRPMRAMVDAALEEMSPVFAELYAGSGRPSIPPERLLRALLLQILLYRAGHTGNEPAMATALLVDFYGFTDDEKIEALYDDIRGSITQGQWALLVLEGVVE